MNPELSDLLKDFRSKHGFSGKGPLCVAIVVTQHARKSGLPLDANNLLTEGGGQVLGMGKNAVQAVLSRHGITKVLAQEGGRTSRGSIGNMREYVSFINALNARGLCDLDTIEHFWIERVHEYFSAKPFSIKLDASKSLRSIVKDLVKQAEDRQKKNPGMQYAGAVLQHIVGAKLSCAMGADGPSHNSFSTSDFQTNRAGDFQLGDVAIHITTAPTESLILKCRQNIDDGYRSIIVTTSRGAGAADVLAENEGIADRLDIFEIEQFVALNLYELGKFDSDGRKVAVIDLITRYNEIIDSIETDPSLKIEIKR